MDGNEAVNGKGPKIYSFPLEIDDEIHSLIHETGEFNGVVSKLTKRKKHRETLETSSESTGFRGLLRHPTAFRVRNTIFMGCLAWMVFLFIGKMNSAMNSIEENNMSDKDPRGIHQSSFGGLENTGHPAGAKAHQKHDEEYLHSWELPKSNVGQGVVSYSPENLMNHNGHYWHDPYQCPFASHLYNRTDEELQAEQDEFDAKMKISKKMWGAWTLVDPYYQNHGKKNRPRADFSDIKNKDAFLTDFPTDAWQLDEEYVAKFVNEAKDMIHRLKEGIYAEYGHPTMAGTTYLTGQALKNRDALFQVIVDDFKVVEGQAVDKNSSEPKQGIAYLNRNAWDGLVQKLLHALITNDLFYVVLAGDGAAAGHGNNFMQSSIMQFHYLMEPLFDFLGVTLVSRNMAMRDATTFSALGGADIYGEADIMWYSGKPESVGQHDLFQKQAILSGERVPVLLTSTPGNIENDSGGAAWVGSLQPGPSADKIGPAMCPWINAANTPDVVPACQLVHCNKVQGWCREAYNSVCWVDRIDFEPPVAQDTEIPPDGNPGPLTHQLEGRMLSMLVLHALDAAFDMWDVGIEEEGFPLNENYWHMGTLYDEVRESVRTHVPKGEEKLPACDTLFSAFPIVCHVEMHAFTEWTPRVNPYASSLSQVLHPRMDSLNFEVEPLYEDIDVLPLQWKVPAGQVDVHAIAISTALPSLLEKDEDALFDDQFFGDEKSWFDYEDDLYYMDYAGEGEDNGNDDGVRDEEGVRRDLRGFQERSLATTAQSTVGVVVLEAAGPKGDSSFGPSTTAPTTAPESTAEAKKKAEEEAAATAKKVEEEAAAAKKAAEEAKKKAEEEAAAAAKKAEEEAAAAKKAEEEAAAAKKAAEEEAAKKAAEAKKKAEEEAAAAIRAQEEAQKKINEAKAAAQGETVKPGLGWTVQNPIPGFCDGSAQSTCNRSSNNTCLMAGHNDFHSGLLGDALSGWLMLRLENVKEGVILARLDATVAAGIDTVTDGWTAINNQGNRRRLNIPGDFMFDYAINGNITSLSRTEFLDFGAEIVYGMTLYPLLMDKTLSEEKRGDNEWEAGERIDVAIRIRSALGRDATILLSHLYYA